MLELGGEGCHDLNGVYEFELEIVVAFMRWWVEESEKGQYG